MVQELGKSIQVGLASVVPSVVVSAFWDDQAEVLNFLFDADLFKCVHLGHGNECVFGALYHQDGGVNLLYSLDRVKAA